MVLNLPVCSLDLDNQITTSLARFPPEVIYQPSPGGAAGLLPIMSSTSNSSISILGASYGFFIFLTSLHIRISHPYVLLLWYSP